MNNTHKTLKQMKTLIRRIVQKLSKIAGVNNVLGKTLHNITI